MLKEIMCDILRTFEAMSYAVQRGENCWEGA